MASVYSCSIAFCFSYYSISILNWSSSSFCRFIRSTFSAPKSYGIFKYLAILSYSS